ncbi:MAG: (deoxy)nucleoside triphosphate pyrophosphohydrolase [Prevotella sp.]|nr:(deoxy)nucleoside triphosphate pyrophosphohydrolase [Prevotella sp.]
MEKRHLNVVCAVVKEGDKYLCMQRLRSNKRYESELWEFPGGKVKEGENDYEALIREIKEEMNWDIYVGRRLASVEHEYPDYTITLTAYLCRGSEEDDFKLYSHLDAKWLTREKMNLLKWTAADQKLLEQF